MDTSQPLQSETGDKVVRAGLVALQPHSPLVASWMNFVERPVPQFHRLEKIHQVVLILQVRYGWPEGKVGNLTVDEVFLALEHATEYDNPARPSIWEITK